MPGRLGEGRRGEGVIFLTGQAALTLNGLYTLSVAAAHNKGSVNAVVRELSRSPTMQVAYIHPIEESHSLCQ
ncbi:hypothetical protein DPEC_G00276830 [Dallia pectoralis]|uniref:Uncharacterized protein n=1 Tax=Dallia pectoralis TaxID=75939 RepID=A0ACC2FLN8_DALPE|nr:hypothetical protein DPEC_G00276830 [Dallia pectoralis]